MSVPKQKGSDITYLEPALWRHLTEAETDPDFCLNWLRLQCRMIKDVSCGVVLFSTEQEGSCVPVAFWPESFHFHQQFSDIIEKVLRDRKGFVLRSTVDRETDPSSEPSFHIAYPLIVNEQLAGVVALEIEPRPSVDLQSAMRQLQWGSAWLKNWLLQKRHEPDAVVRQQLTIVFDVIAVALQEERFKSAATRVVTDIASRLNCDRVSIGFLKNKHARVAALSHSAKFDRQTNLIRSVGNAMDECLDQEEILVWPQSPELEDSIQRAHAELARLHGSGAICSVPLLAQNGEGYGALTFERSADQPFTVETLELCEAIASLLGPILEEKRQNDRLLLLKIKESFSRLLGNIVGPGHLTAKIITCCLAGLTIFFAYAQGDYRVSAITSLEATIQRVIPSPFEGYLYEARQRAGDVVKEGQVLASLDTRDLVLEQRKWSSEKEQRFLEYQKALAENEIAMSSIIQEQIKQSESQLALLGEQIRRARILAPFDGMLISGDLTQSIGAPMRQGDVLFEIAPLDSYRVMLEIDEKDIEQVLLQQNGELILNSLPTMSFPFIVDKITAVSTTREGRNYFVAEGHLLVESDRLRPGMQGYGKIFIDRRKLIWIWTHRLLDRARLWFWSWLP